MQNHMAESEVVRPRGITLTLRNKIMGLPAYKSAMIYPYFFVWDALKADGKALFVFDVERKKYLNKILTTGKGPCEHTILISLYGNADKISWYDPNLKKFSRFNVDNAIEEDSIFCPETAIDFRKTTRRTEFSQIIPLSEKQYLAYVSLGSKRNEIYYVLDSLGNALSAHGSFPLIESYENLPFKTLKKYYYDANLVFNPNLNKLVTISRRGLLEVNNWNSDSLSLTLEKRIIMYNPDLNIRNNSRISIKDKTVVGATISKVSNKYIYIAFESSSYGQYYKRDQKIGLGHKLIYVLDYDLQPIKTIIPEHRFFAFEVKEDDSKLYTISNLPEPSIVEYDL